MFALKRANTTCRQQTATVNLPHNHFKKLEYYTVSNWYYIFVTTLNRGTSQYT